MVAESVVWTVLPNGLDDNAFRATILVSPRLTADAATPFQSIRDFPAFTDWPATLARLEFQVEVDGGETVPAAVDPRIARADSDTWRLIFGDAVGVLNREFQDHSRRTIRTFPATEVARHVLDTYGRVAVQFAWDYPPATSGPLAELAGEIGDIGDGIASTDPDRPDPYRELEPHFVDVSEIAERRRGRYLVRGHVPLEQRRRVDFLQAYRFYDRFRDGHRVRQAPGPIAAARVPPGPDAPHYDFHAYVSALGDYPLLLRRLGFAIDVTLPADSPLAGDHRLRLIVGGQPQPWMLEPAGRPWLNCRFDADRLFLPRPRVEIGQHGSGDFERGQLALRVHDFFEVHQVDIDGSALKTAHVAASALTIKNHLAATQPSVTPDSCSLPALRGSGFTVVRRDRAAAVVAQLDHSLVNEQTRAAGQPADLFAEDVTRGYRVDVQTDGGPGFLSLAQRVGTYQVRTPSGVVPLEVPADEGFTKAASTTAVPADDELYLHEAVFSWGGWSQVVKRPGATVNIEEEVEDPAPEPDVDPALPLVTSFEAAPGTLPRLRYGRDYRFRARLVDLAGNSVDAAAIGDEQASAPATFFRWEPVGSPAVLPRRPYAEGASQLRMVIRSTAGLPTSDYVGLPRVQQLPGHTDPDTAYEATDERWLAAPKTSQQMAELHGVFDAAIGSGQPHLAVEDAFDVAAREAGVLPEQVPAAELTLPYLPDVSSRGVSLTTLPGDSAATRLVGWPADDPAVAAWWDRQPFRIRIAEGPTDGPVTPTGPPRPPDWDPTARLLTVFVPQAETVVVRLSSHLNPADLDLQGLWNRVGNELSPTDRNAAIRGRMWMFTPWVTLTLVHAVEKPLLDPVVAVSPSGMQRLSGETLCVLEGAIDNHAKSTARLDIEAAWTEQVDDPAAAAPDDGMDGRPLRSGHAHVGDFTLEADEDHCLTGREDVRPTGAQFAVHRLRHELGDTKHRHVGYTAVATTRFREYFPPQIVGGVDPDSGERYVVQTGPQVQRHVPSSRRPDPPEIAYIVPTFDWHSETQLGFAQPGQPPSPVEVRRTRRGGGVRVYLKRPWYSSGDGELLGVVLEDQPWLTWPLDLAAGIPVAEGDRQVADRLAATVIEHGRESRVLREAGHLGSAPAERLLRMVGTAGDDLTDPDRARAALSQVVAGLAPLEDILTGLIGPSGIDPEKLHTRWGSDPVWGSVPPAAGPFIHQFALRTAVGTGLALAETNQARVTVVGHPPQYDSARQLWFCDLQLDAGDSYFPFVRLGLCRYQPHAIPGAEISRVVPADFTQLVPEREATFTPQSGRVQVVLRGPAGYTYLAGQRPGPATEATGVAASRRVTAQVQHLAPGADADLDWVGQDDESELGPAVGSHGLGAVRWAGSIGVPTAPAGTRRRVLVREYELHWTDDPSPDPLARTEAFFPGSVATHHDKFVRERLVYADSWELPVVPGAVVIDLG